jgi:hypothetical protein
MTRGSFSDDFCRNNDVLIPLTDGKQHVSFDFNPPPIQNWPKQNQYHLTLLTNLGAPFSQVFIKRWDNRKAPAHELFLAACGKDIPGAPKIYGVCEEGSLVIYVSAFMPGYEILQNLLKSDPEQWLTSPTMMNILNQAIETFEALRLYRFMYPHICQYSLQI